MDKNTLVTKGNLKTLTNYLKILSLIIILFSTNTLAIASTSKNTPRFADIQNQIIDLAPTETDVPKSLRAQLSKQSKIVLLNMAKGSTNYSNGKANLEISQPERGREKYVNFNPLAMYFSAHQIDLNNDYKPELEITYVGFEASAINWPLWIFSVDGENYIPILTATVNMPGYSVLQSFSNGYHDILTTKTIVDKPNQKPKNEFTIYKFDGTKYIIKSKFIELSSQDANKL
jgi:hypothetical protein